MSIYRPLLFFSALCCFTGCLAPKAKTTSSPSPVVPTYSQPPHFAPKIYACPLTSAPIKVDGNISDPAWQKIPFSDSFVDITGDPQKSPFLDTKVKMLWDDNYLYIAAQMEDHHIWGTLTERDAVIYADNDFEVFIDPDSDTHHYYELEINALGTVWDLLLFYPYRDASIEAGQPYLNHWDIRGLKSAVKVDGTINHPLDKDRRWTVELAIPWQVLCETNTEKRLKPEIGQYWRMNFSRVHWHTQVENGHYQKIPEKAEENWVWSPQGVVAMHQPETWGVVYFVDTKDTETYPIPAIEQQKWILRQLYYRQWEFKKANGFFTPHLALLQGQQPIKDLPTEVKIETTTSMFEISIPYADGRLFIRQDGKTWQK